MDKVPPTSAWAQEQQEQQEQQKQQERMEKLEANDAQEVSGSDTDDENYDDPARVIQQFSSHKLMKRAQRALVAQLKGAYERVTEDLKAKQDDLKRLKREREDVGVELYGMQQQLAKLQVNLENAHNKHTALLESRMQEEDMLKDFKDASTEKVAAVDEHKRQLVKHQSELSALQDTLRQIESYNEEMRGEIATTRRATYKAEQSLQGLEKNKKEQDLYIDSLTDTVLKLEQQLELLQEQVQVQRKETNEAVTVLSDTERELELIAFEKKQLMQEWKASLIGLAKRDEALAQATTHLREAEMAVADFEMELDGIRRKVTKAQQENESLVHTKDRTEAEVRYVEESLSRIRQESEEMQRRYVILQKSLAQTTDEEAKLEIARKNQSSEMDAALSSIQVVTQTRQKLEEDITLTRSSKATVDKAVRNLARSQARVLQSTHAIERDIALLENETARGHLEILKTLGGNIQLRNQLDALSAQLAAKEAIVTSYQTEVRQRNDEVEKKMCRVDRLNRKYEKLVEKSGGEEALGPMELTLKAIHSETQQISSDCNESERQWLIKQTELVGIAADADTIYEESGDSRARITILTEQQLRLNKALHKLDMDLKATRSMNTALARDTDKLNQLISENSSKQQTLQNANFILEKECIEELRTMERESCELQARTQSSREQKDAILDQIVETERQLLLWEKKLQLDKDTREVLDPSSGQAETVEMEKEVHRMRVRLDTLKREQERLVTEMERAIYKREMIEARFKGKILPVLSRASTKDLSQANLTRKIGSLRKDTRNLSQESMNYTSAIEQRKAQISEMTSELERVTSRYGQLEDEVTSLQASLNELLYFKQRHSDRIQARQKYIKRLREISATTAVGSELDVVEVERKLSLSLKSIEDVRDVINDLKPAFPTLMPVLERICAMTEDST